MTSGTLTASTSDDQQSSVQDQPSSAAGEDNLSSSVADLRRKAQQHSAAIMETLAAVEHKKQIDSPDTPTQALVDSSEKSQLDT